MRTGKQKLMKLINKIIVTIVGIVITIILIFAPKDNKNVNNKINIAYGNDASGVIINYMVHQNKLNNAILENIEDIEMNDC